MIQKTSTAVTKWLLHAGAISIEDKELYEYAAYSFLFSLIPLFLVFIFGLALGMVTEGILMILPFMLVRKFSGGLHLKSARICLISSSVMLISFLLLIKATHTYEAYAICSAAVLIFSIQLFLLSPVDSEARRLSEKERLVFRRVARSVTFVSCSAYFLLLFFGLYRFAVPLGFGIILSGLLQFPCFLKLDSLQKYTQ